MDQSIVWYMKGNLSFKAYQLIVVRMSIIKPKIFIACNIQDCSTYSHGYTFLSIHPFIPGLGGWGQQSKQRCPNLAFPSHLLQLFYVYTQSFLNHHSFICPWGILLPPGGAQEASVRCLNHLSCLPFMWSWTEWALHPIFICTGGDVHFHLLQLQSH